MSDRHDGHEPLHDAAHPDDGGGGAASYSPDKAEKPAQKSKKMSRSQGAQVMREAFARWGARIGLAWILVLVVLAVFAPALANSHPLAIKYVDDPVVHYPALEYLHWVDASLFIAFAAGVLLWILPLVPGGVKWFLFLVAVIGGSVTCATQIDPPKLQLYEQYREAIAQNRVEWVLDAPIPYSPNDRMIDTRENKVFQPPELPEHLRGDESDATGVRARVRQVLAGVRSVKRITTLNSHKTDGEALFLELQVEFDGTEIAKRLDAKKLEAGWKGIRSLDDATTFATGASADFLTALAAETDRLETRIRGSVPEAKFIDLDATLASADADQPQTAPVSAPDGQTSSGVANPYGNNWLGTDSLGQDLASRMIHASRIALSIGFISTGIAAVIGIIIGGLMGYFSGVVDILGMRLLEIFQAVPQLFLLLTFVAFFGANLYYMMIIIGLTSWPGFARFIRAEFLKLRAMDYVQAGKSLGLPLRSILFRHMLPNGVAPLLVAASFGVAGAIIAEATLSFLGLGLQEDPSWGQMLNEATTGAAGKFHWWIAIFPGLAIFLTVLAYNLIGEALRDAIDPHLKKVAT